MVWSRSHGPCFLLSLHLIGAGGMDGRMLDHLSLFFSSLILALPSGDFACFGAWFDTRFRR